MTPATLKKGLEKVRRFCDSDRFDKAFAEIDKLREQWPDNPHVLVMWANLLQLQEADVGPPLDEAPKALKRAVDLDERSPLPLIELGHYLYAIDDDARGASKCFDKAIALCKDQLTEALVGHAKALAELGRKSEALACLAEAYWFGSHNGQSTNGKVREEILQGLGEVGQSV